MIIMAIDPGASGGVFVRFSKGDVMIRKLMPVTELADWIREIKGEDFIIAFVEEINFRLTERSRMNRIHATSKVFANYQQILTVMQLTKTTHVIVHPKRWQTYIQKQYNVMSFSRKPKLAYRDFARKVYPDQKGDIILDTSDAVCIGICAWDWMKSQPKWITSRLQKHGRDF